MGGGGTLGLPQDREQLGFTILGRSIDGDQTLKESGIVARRRKECTASCPPVPLLTLL